MSAEPDTAAIAKADDAFSHGGTYPPSNGQVRRKTCASCAFVKSPESVRPADVSIEALERATADYDDFLCHCFDEEGRAFTCAGWAARFGPAKE